MNAKLIAALVLLCITVNSFATHLRCGYITIKKINGNNVSITVTVYTNTLNTSVLFGGDQDVLDFGDGTSMTIPESQGVPLDGMPNIHRASFTTQHTYSAPGFYIVSYKEPNRNENILNISASVATQFYLESGFTLDPFLSEYQSPTPFFDPIFPGFTHSDLSISLASADSMGNVLSYYLGTPSQDRGTAVLNYQQPSKLSLNELTGLLEWQITQENPLAGEYLLAFRIDQHRIVDGKKKRTGYQYRDLQVILSDNETDGRIAGAAEDFQRITTSGATLKVYGFPAEGRSTEMVLRTDFPEDLASFTTYDSTSTVTSETIKVGVVTLNYDDKILRTAPYVVTVRSTLTTGSTESFADFSYGVATDLYEEWQNPIMGKSTEERLVDFSPNPFRSLLRINGDLPFNSSVILISVDGRRTHLLDNRDQEVDVSGLPNGLYLVQLKDNSGRLLKQQKMIKME